MHGEKGGAMLTTVAAASLTSVMRWGEGLSQGRGFASVWP